MSDRDHAIRELAALLEADLLVSGAKTPAEMHAALKGSLLSLMSEPQIEVIEPTEVERCARLMTVQLHGPRLPG